MSDTMRVAPGQNVYQAETNAGEDVAVRAGAALRPGGPRPV
jgi:glutamate-1-semialdehyde aminotransferase